MNHPRQEPAWVQADQREVQRHLDGLVATARLRVSLGRALPSSIIDRVAVLVALGARLERGTTPPELVAALGRVRNRTAQPQAARSTRA